MERLRCWMICLVCLGIASRSFAVPITSSITNEIAESIEEEGEEGDDPSFLDDGSTTHGLERLSSAATCLVAGVEYTHGQQIYRHDQCEFCLCLDGEMFCWWQDCPPTMDGPCKDKGPFSPCISVPVVNPHPIQTSTFPSVEYSSGTITGEHIQGPSSTKQVILETISKLSIGQSYGHQPESELYSSTDRDDLDVTSENPSISTSIQPKYCLIMGRQYQIGDKLPHDTGNCLECICGNGAKVTCSPYQCSPAGDEINDYRMPGPRQPIPGMF